MKIERFWYNRKINFTLFLQKANISSIKRTVHEVRIPISSGCISGKWWGPEDKQPILAIHGYQDNAGTYDRLIPLLSENTPILAIDLPGHGFSYKLPPGLAYHEIDSIIVLNRIKRFFGWPNISLMGHSMGATLGFTYGLLFPNEVDIMVCLDGLHPLIHRNKMERISKSINELIKYDILKNSNEEPPIYTIQEITQKFFNGYNKTIDIEATKYILYRNISPSKKYPGKFYFNRDVRLKTGRLVIYDPQEILRLAERMKFPILAIKCG